MARVFNLFKFIYITRNLSIPMANQHDPFFACSMRWRTERSF